MIAPEDRNFAERLRERIESDPDVTPAGLAVRAGLDNSTIRNLLSGRIKNPRVDTARKICAALGTTLEEFMSNARDESERELVRLISQLSDRERAELLGYGKALAASRDPRR